MRQKKNILIYLDLRRLQNSEDDDILKTTQVEIYHNIFFCLISLSFN